MCFSWEKILLAARIIAAIENPEDVVVVSSRQFGQRSVFKFAQVGRHTLATESCSARSKPTEETAMRVTVLPSEARGLTSDRSVCFLCLF